MATQGSVTTTEASADVIELESMRAPEDFGKLDAMIAGASDTNVEPRQTMDLQTKLKIISCAGCFLVAGLNDGSIGALLPYVIRTHGLTTTIASSV